MSANLHLSSGTTPTPGEITLLILVNGEIYIVLPTMLFAMYGSDVLMVYSCAEPVESYCRCIASCCFLSSLGSFEGRGWVGEGVHDLYTHTQMAVTWYVLVSLHEPLYSAVRYIHVLQKDQKN